MLREITDVRQEPGEAVRRWFTGKDLELIVWTDAEGALRRFQLAYDRGRQERVVQWIRGGGLSHHRVDTGEVHPLQPKATPILLPEPGPPPAGLREDFRAAAAEIDPALREAVAAALSGSGWPAR